MPEMKDSGIEWIGEMPKEWRMIRLKYLHNGSNVGESIDKDYWSSDDNDKVFYTAGMIPINTTYEKFPEWKFVGNNDLLLARNGTPYVYLPLQQAMYSDHIIRIKVNELFDRRFLRYCLQRSIEAVVVDTVSISTWSISLWNEQSVTFPSKAEQKLIADFLDSKCAEIDSLIADIEKEIALLEEYKKSVIFNTIKHGVKNTDFKRTDSAIWDSIPADWDLIKIKYLFEIVKRIAGKEGYDIIAITQKGLRVKDISANEGQIAADYSGYQFVYPGDFAMNHMDLLSGWVDLSNLFGVTSPDYRVFKLRDTEKNDRLYWKYVMQCCYMCQIFYALGQGVSNLGRWRLPASEFNNFMVPVPSYDEQVEIGKYLESAISEIEGILDKKQEELSVLADYKKSLIYEYVTGKKEV